MRMKRAVLAEPNNAANPTAIRRLLTDISPGDLESLVVEVILEHRRRLQRAQASFVALERNDEDPAAVAAVHRLRQDYHMATLNPHAQHQLVSLVVAALGYVPDVDGSPSSKDVLN